MSGGPTGVKGVGPLYRQGTSASVDGVILQQVSQEQTLFICDELASSCAPLLAAPYPNKIPREEMTAPRPHAPSNDY